jgi:hypothetical protein
MPKSWTTLACADGVVLQGRVRLWLGDREIDVDAGEPAEFSTMTPHSLSAPHASAELIISSPERASARTSTSRGWGLLRSRDGLSVTVNIRSATNRQLALTRRAPNDPRVRCFGQDRMRGC